MESTMYHISREENWKAGDIIVSGKNENPFWVQCKNYLPQMRVNDQVLPLFEMFDIVTNFDVTENNISFLYENLKNVSKESAFYMREQVFEDIRQTLFPDLPSRQKCLWVTELDQIDYWKTILAVGNRFMLSLELEGNLFCGDDHWLSANTLSSVEYSNRAMHYWAGEMSATSRKEYLFSGKAIVKEVTPI